MKGFTTSDRLKQLIAERNLRQVDILEAAKPYCAKYAVKLGKNDLSQYVSGKVEPGQEKLSILGAALGVSETWLMGYDVPMQREKPTAKSDELSELEKMFMDLPTERRDEVLRYMRYLVDQQEKNV